KEELDEAVKVASAAFRDWKKVPVPERARILFKYQQLLVSHWDELAELITTENGKNFKEAYGEVQRGIENVEFAAGAPSLMMGDSLSTSSSGLDSSTYRYPIGVIGGITPFNFPMMVPAWMFPIAIATGNTFVMKPSERTPLLANRLAELLQEAGLPDGVFNIVHGAHDVVNGLLDHQDIAAISFVGSQPVAEYVYKRGTDQLKRVQALSGAKNHSIVLSDANLDNATTQIMNAAFGSAGERCMACAVVAVEDEVADKFIEQSVEKANNIKIGNGLDEGIFLGHVIRSEHKAASAKEVGYFVRPTIFDGVASEMKIWPDDLFAPVLSIARVKYLDEAISLSNQSSFANGSCIFTNDGGSVQQFREEIDAAMIGVNIGVPAPMAFFPFSAWKDSFYGD